MLSPMSKFSIFTTQEEIYKELKYTLVADNFLVCGGMLLKRRRERKRKRINRKSKKQRKKQSYVLQTL